MAFERGRPLRVAARRTCNGDEEDGACIAHAFEARRGDRARGERECGAEQDHLVRGAQAGGRGACSFQWRSEAIGLT